jgi:hypothetical protein
LFVLPLAQLIGKPEWLVPLRRISRQIGSVFHMQRLGSISVLAMQRFLSWLCKTKALNPRFRM